MKILKNILYLFAITLVVVSCDTNDEVTGYESNSELYDYDFVPKGDYSIAVDAATVTESSFNVVATSTEAGSIYYIVADASAAAPTNQSVHDAGNSLSIEANSTATFNVDGGALLDAADFTVYAVFKNADNFISESVTSLSQSLSGCPTIGGTYYGVPTTDVSTLPQPFTAILTPTSNPNEYSLDTTWGSNFFYDITGGTDRSFIGLFPYESILKINDDLSVTVTGTGDSRTPGGTGTYTLCDNIIEVTLLVEGLFTIDFTVDVTFTKQ